MTTEPWVTTEQVAQHLGVVKDTVYRWRERKGLAPEPGVKDSDQINLTDEESRIMPVSGGGFDQCYNAQAGVDAHTMLVVATTLTQAPNDKQQVTPILNVLQEQADKLGAASTLIADTGYCSDSNVKACETADLVPIQTALPSR
jgi:hypothetical protein